MSVEISAPTRRGLPACLRSKVRADSSIAIPSLCIQSSPYGVEDKKKPWEHGDPLGHAVESAYAQRRYSNLTVSGLASGKKSRAPPRVKDAARRSMLSLKDICVHPCICKHVS